MNTSLANVLGLPPDPHPMRDAFLRWQCRVRQMAMRDGGGMPDAGVMPTVLVGGQEAGKIITVMNKLPAYSRTPEMQHMVKQTFDPAQRRSKAIELFSETYYQKAREFSDILCAVFQPGSQGAETLRKAGQVVLVFDHLNQRFEIPAKPWKLTRKNAYFQATWWHNHLFNPDLSEDVVILGFEPDWPAARATPSPV